MSLIQPRYTHAARRDMTRILEISRDNWGESARRRYRALIEAAVADIAERPDRAGVRAIADYPGLSLYHLRNSRDRANERVAAPPHQIVFRTMASGGIEIVRVVHERVDLPTALRGSPRP